MLRLGANWRLLLDCDLSLQISAHEEVATRYPRRIASIPLLERAGRLTHDLAEAAAERTEAAEPHTKTDLRDGEVRRSEQILCPFNSALGDVRCRCSPVGGSELAVKVKFGERRHRREVLQSERLGKVSIGVISRSAQLDQCMNRNFRCLHGHRIDRRNSRTGSVPGPALNRRTWGEFSVHRVAPEQVRLRLLSLTSEALVKKPRLVIRHLGGMSAVQRYSGSSLSVVLCQARLTSLRLYRARVACRAAPGGEESECRRW